MAWWIGDSTCRGTNTIADQRQRQNQVIAPLDRAHKRADRDGEQRGQDPAQHEHRPPGHREGAVSLRQDPEELPLVACEKTFDHRCSCLVIAVPDSRFSTTGRNRAGPSRMSSAVSLGMRRGLSQRRLQQDHCIE